MKGEATESLPLLTVVVPVFNEEKHIAATIGQLLAQDYPAEKTEILVVDGGSTDATRQIVREITDQHPRVKLVDNPKRRSSAARNIGFRVGRGDFFVVIDGHCCIPDKGLLRHTVTLFQQTGADCLARPQPLTPPGLSRFQEAVALARAARIGHGADSFIYSDFEGFSSPVSNGAAYRRQVFAKVGYVDERFDACEDVEFNYRLEQAGLKCYTSPRLAVLYYPRETLTDLFRQLVRYGRGRRRFTRKHPAALSLQQLVPLLFVLGLPLAAAGGGTMVVQGKVSLLPALLVAPYLLYLALLLAVSGALSWKHGWRYFRYLPVLFFTIHTALGYGFLKELWEGDG